MIVRNGRIVAVEFCRTEKNDEGDWIEDDEQIFRLKADFVISAFGSELHDLDGNPYKFFFTSIYKY